MRNFSVSIAALLVLSAPALAEQRIGSAALIEKEVMGLAGERKLQQLRIGDEVYFQELLTTGADSRGKFVFDDRANLQMGPLSQLKLDSFVYRNAPAVAFNAAKGAFRFVSAPGGHKGYEVRTPKATIGVRGTAFGVRATPERTDAVLYDGAIEVCLPESATCRVLDKPCTFVTITGTGFTTTRDVGPDDWSFDDSCKREQPAPKRRRGAVEPPRSAPPPVIAPTRMSSPRPRPPAPPRRRITRAEPPQPVHFRPPPPPPQQASYAPRPERPQRVRPQRPFYPPVSRPKRPYDDYRRPQRQTYYPRPEPEPYYPPPRPRYPGPFFPPVVHVEMPYRPHFPRPMGHDYPSGMHGDGPYSPPMSRGPFPGRSGWGGGRGGGWGGRY